AFAAPEDEVTDDSGTAGNGLVEPAAGDGPPMATPPLPDEPVERPLTDEEVGPASSAQPVVAPDAADSPIAATADGASSAQAPDRPASSGAAHTPSLDGSIESAGAGVGGTAHAPVAPPQAIVERAVAEASADVGPVAPAASVIPPRHAPAVARAENALAPDAAADRVLATADPVPMHPAATEPAMAVERPDAGSEPAP